eukprot:972741-Prymnesium_polylepis.1
MQQASQPYVSYDFRAARAIAAHRGTLSPIAESPHRDVLIDSGANEMVLMIGDQSVAEVSGRIGERVIAAARQSKMPDSAVLMDDGATCNIRTSDRGRIPHTWQPSNGPLAIGDSGAKLESLGTHLYAETRIGADGVEEDRVERCEFTPSGIANINSEGIEVEKRGATLMWAPGRPREFKLPDGKVLKCHMTSNHLAWLKTKPIECPLRLKAAVLAYKASNGEACMAVGPSDPAARKLAQADDTA